MGWGYRLGSRALFVVLLLLGTMVAASAATRNVTEAIGGNTETTISGVLTINYPMDHPAGYLLMTESLGPIVLILSPAGEGDLYRYNRATIEVTGDLVTQDNQWILYVKEWVPLMAVAALPTVSGPQSTIMILFQTTDEPGINPVSHFQDLLTGASNSMNAYFVEDSYNTITVTGNPTSQWYTLPHPSTYYNVHTWQSCISGGDYTTLAHDIVDTVDSDVNFANYAHIFFVSSDNWVWGCAVHWAGEGIPTNDGVSITHAPFVSEDRGLPTYVHEFSHDLGLPDLYDYDYADPYTFIDGWDLMGVDTAQHHSSWCKIQLGWIPPSKIATFTGTGTVTVTIDRIEYPTSGYHTLKIQTPSMPTTSYFLVETRQKTGFDNNIPENAPDHGVLITKIDETAGSGHGIVRLVDQQPATQQWSDGDAVWQVGQTYVDGTYAFSVHVESWFLTGFVITVSLGRLYHAVFYTNPTSFVGSEPGTITFDGATYRNGETAHYISPSGPYEATANAPSPEYQFAYWTHDASLDLSSVIDNPTSVSVRPYWPEGLLKAWFSAKITFHTLPSNIGAIELDGGSYRNRESRYDERLPPYFSGTLTVRAVVPSREGMVFKSWTCSGGLSCSGTSNPTTVTFTGPGRISATYVALAKVTVKAKTQGVSLRSGWALGGEASGVVIKVDNVLREYRTPFTVSLMPGKHTFTAPSAVIFGGIKYRFVGWAVGSGAVVSTGTSFTYDIQSDTTLYAVYQP